MARKINVNLFSRFQDSLKLENSDGSTNSITESVQPVVDISPQIQDSVTDQASDSITTAGGFVLHIQVPEGESWNIKQISSNASRSNNTKSITFNAGGGNHVVYESISIVGWEFFNTDMWLNSGEELLCTITTTYSGGIDGYMTIYGLRYSGV